MRPHHSPAVLFVVIVCSIVLTACGGSAPAAYSPRATSAGQTQSQNQPVPQTQTDSGAAQSPNQPIPQVPVAEAPIPSPAPAEATSAPSTEQQSAEGAPVPQPSPQPIGGFTSAAEDSQSTFGMDVDTASYTTARNYLQRGELPPAAMVRTEEFINYFDYHYPSPDNDAFGVAIESAPSPFSAGTTQLVRIGIQGRRISEEQRKPTVLTFVIDVSGSMQEPNKLPLVKQSLTVLLDQLKEGDRVAIVTYGSQAATVLKHTDASQRETILNALNALGDGGSTNAEAGLQVGYAEAAQAFNGDATNRVILCSDGVANVGATGPNGLLDSIRKYRDEGIYLTTVGFGMGDYNDYLMEQLADNGDGNYAYVDTLDEAQRIFADSLTGTLEVIAKDAKLQVEFDPKVVDSYRLLGYENRAIADTEFRNDSIDAGEVGAGHHVTALYELRMRQDATGEALRVHVRYLDPQRNEVVELMQPFTVEGFGRDFAQASPELQLAVGAAAFAENLRGSQMTPPQALSTVQQIANIVNERWHGDKDVAEFAELVSRASALK